MIGGLTALMLGGLVAATPCDNSLSGKVLDSASGKPLAGARVEAGEGSKPVKTNSSGRFKLEGVCEGSVELRAVRRGYALRRMKVGAGRAGNVTIRLTSMTVRKGDEVRVQAPRLKASDTRSVVSLEGEALLRTRIERRLKNEQKAIE